MAKFRFQKSSLVGGEVSGNALGRTDLPAYAHACRMLRNMIPWVSGGAYRRPGTLNENTASGSLYLAPLLVPFYSDTFDSSTTSRGAYCHAILNPITSAALTLVTHAPNRDNQTRSSTSTSSGTGPVGMVAQVSPADTTNLDPDIFYDPMLEAQSAQSGDSRFIAIHTQMPQKVVRALGTISSSTGLYPAPSFSLADYNGSVAAGAATRDSVPYLAQNTNTAINLFVDSNAAPTTLTAVVAAAGAVTSFFTPGHVGAYFKINNGGTIGCCRVTAFVSASVVTVTPVVSFGANGTANAVATWWECAWSTYRGFPRAVCFFANRLCFAGTKYQPDTLWFSKVGDFTTWSVSTDVDPYTSSTATDHFTMDLESRDLAAIQSLSSQETIFVNTRNSEYTIAYDSSTSPPSFGPQNRTITKQTNYGAEHVQSVRIENELLFVDRSGQRIMALAFSFAEQSFAAEDIQVLFDEYPKVERASTVKRASRRIRQIAWDQSRSTLWCIDTMGNLFAVTRDRQKGLTAWSSHQIGGYDATVTGSNVAYSGANTVTDPIYYAPTGSVVSICTVRNPSNGMDDLWMCVKRKINDNWQYFIDRMIGEHIREDDAYAIGEGQSNIYTDSSFWGSNSLATYVVNDAAITMQGETPVGMCYNAYGMFYVVGSAMTAGGNTTIQTPYPGHYLADSTSQLFLGYNFSSIIIPTRPELGSQIGSAQGAIKRLNKVVTRFYKTICAKIGADASNLETIHFRDAAVDNNQSADLYTGDKRIFVDCDYDLDGYLYILQDRPLPFAVISVAMEGEVYD